MTKLNKGFTLIELLVVIAIIGILSGLIIVSMSSAQNSAKDARIKADMDQMRTVAALYYNTTGAFANYGTVTTNGACATAGTNFVVGTDGAALVTDMNSQQATTPTCWGPTTTLTTYCVLKTLNGGSGVTHYWCIDSNGWSGNPSTTDGCTSAVHNLCNN